MMDDELDQMLFTRDEIVPSSGFVASVMDAVQQEAATPKPIPFPWMRALPVFVALAAVLVMLVVGLVKLFRMPVAAAQEPVWMAETARLLGQANAGWIAFAFLLTFISTWFSIRMAVGKR
jgi:hypothetical protein